jgi:chloride channel protein, CIC family
MPVPTLSKLYNLASKPSRRLIFDALVLGIVGALCAQLFVYLLKASESLLLFGLADYKPPGLPDEGGVLIEFIGSHGLWLIPLVTTFGGLLSGILVYSLAPESEGHGTDTVVRAYHRTLGFIRSRVAPIKMIASAITIGSGGAAGREGPAALIGAGFASIYSSILKRSLEERRLLILIGMAAGLSAVFRSPIGSALFVIEVLYRDMEFESGALLYTMLGSVIAFIINGLFVGWEPLFRIPVDIGVHGVTDYLWFTILGILSGLVAAIVPVIFYGFRDAFKSINIPNHFKPAIGGLGIGLIALILPQVLGGGYGWIQEAIDGSLAIELLLVLLLAKIVAFALTIGSGGSGGVFAPTLFVGAMLGGVMAQLFDQPPAAFVIIGMTAVFAGAARVPIATMLMVTEMTGSYKLLAPAALAVMISFLLQGALSKRLKYKSLYEAQVTSRAESPAHHFEHIQTALRLINEKKINLPATISHLDLYAVLSSGISLDLPDDKRIIIGTLKAESAWNKKPFQAGKFKNEIELAAVLRDGHVLIPDGDTELAAGDQLLFITSKEALEYLNKHIAPLTYSSQ